MCAQWARQSSMLRQNRAPRPGPPGEPVSCPGRIRCSRGRSPQLPSLEHEANQFGWGVCTGGGRGVRQKREIRAVLTTEGRGGGRAHSQPPAEVLSGSSCVPPDSWHDAGRGGGGSAPTSCAQLSPGHIAPPQLFPSPAAGLLNWRFVPEQGNNAVLVGGGGEYGGKEGKSEGAGDATGGHGAMRGGTAGRSGNGRLNSRQPGKERAGAAEGRLWGARSGWSDPGGPRLRSQQWTRPSRHTSP